MIRNDIWSLFFNLDANQNGGSDVPDQQLLSLYYFQLNWQNQPLPHALPLSRFHPVKHVRPAHACNTILIGGKGGFHVPKLRAATSVFESLPNLNITNQQEAF